MSSFPWPQPQIEAAAYVAETAVICGDVHLAEGASVWPTAVLRGDVEAIRVGAHSNVQDGAVLHGDPGRPTVLEEYVTVGHRAVIHSAHVERGCLIGIGAIVLDGVRVGAGSIIGAGAVVTRDVPPGSLVMGMPGKVVREVTAEQQSDLVEHARKYETLALAHAGRSASTGFVTA